MGAYLRKLELLIVGIHLAYLVARGRAEHLDDLDELVDARVARKDGLTEQELGEDAAGRPYVDVARVVGGAEDELGRAIVARANVGDVELALDELLGAAEVAQLEYGRLGVEQQVLRLDVAVAYAHGVYVGETAEQLVHEELDVEDGYGLLGLGVVARHLVHRLRYELEHQVEVDLLAAEAIRAAYEEEVQELHHVLVVQSSHDLQLSIL